MKLLLILSIVSTMLISSSECNKKKTNSVLKGRLEIKGICYNYTIKLLEGSIDTSLISAEWTDENTGKNYTDVFGLAESCKFPSSIKEGDEFNFIIDTTISDPCIVCNAYYPTPPRKLKIKVVEN